MLPYLCIQYTLIFFAVKVPQVYVTLKFLRAWGMTLKNKFQISVKSSFLKNINSTKKFSNVLLSFLSVIQEISYSKNDLIRKKEKLNNTNQIIKCILKYVYVKQASRDIYPWWISWLRWWRKWLQILMMMGVL